MCCFSVFILSNVIQNEKMLKINQISFNKFNKMCLDMCCFSAFILSNVIKNEKILRNQSDLYPKSLEQKILLTLGGMGSCDVFW